MSLARQAAYDFATFYERRESDRWALADICALLSHTPGALVALVDELAGQFGIGVTLQTLKNYARVAKSFEDKHRHLQYKWSNYLEWSKHSNPIKAMELALDNGYSPTQMSRLRRHGDPEYREEKPIACDICGGDLLQCHHGTDSEIELGKALEKRGFRRALGNPDAWIRTDETKTRGLELRDKKLEGPAEDRQEESISQKEDGKA